MEYRKRIAQLVPRLRRYARALLSAPAPADNLVHATVERAAKLLPQLRREPDLRIWLFSMMHDSYVETARHASAARVEAEKSDFEKAMEQLAPEQREVFLLVTLEEMSYEEVARTLDAPLTTVLARLSQARETLRLVLMGQTRLTMVK